MSLDHGLLLEQSALSENKEYVFNIKLAFKFLLLKFDKFEPNETSPVNETKKKQTSEPFVSRKYYSRKLLLTTVQCKNCLKREIKWRNKQILINKCAGKQRL